MASNTIDLKYLVNYDQLKAANAEILKIGSNAQKSASVFEKSFRKVELENKKALTSVNQRIAFSKRMEAQKAKEARVTQQEAEQEARALERLRQKYDQGHVAMEIYSRELNDLGTALKRKIITTDQYTKELERLNTATKMGTVVSSEFGGVAGQTGRHMSRSGVMVQQAGYQIGDFIVQVQSGQNAMVAFGQQATQMAGTLTMMGGKWLAIGTGLGVVIPLVTAAGAAFLRARKDVDETSKSLKTLESNLDSLDKKLEGWIRTKKAASLGVTVDEIIGIEGVESIKAEIENFKARKKLLESLSPAGLGSKRRKKELEEELREIEPKLKEAVKRLADIEAKIRQEAREKAEAELLASMEEQNRERALSEYEAGQKIIAERKAWTEEAIGIFKAAQKRMRDEDVAVTERTLQHLFRSRTLFYSIRFSGDQEVMSQSLTPSGKMKPSQSYEELIAMGWTPEDLERIGMTPPRKPSRGGGASQQDPLAKLRERIKLDTELLGKTKERQEVERAIANSSVEYSQKAIDKAVAELEAYNQIVEKRQELQGIYDTAQSSMEEGFMAMVEGTKSVEDAFKDMARSIIKELYQVYVIKRMVSGITGAIDLGAGGSLFGGNSWGGTLAGRASGGTVQANQPYLVGEKGPELIVPRNRGHVMNADLTANAMGGGGDVYVTNNFTMAANGDDSVKRIIAQSMPAIVNASKQGVMDARRRGGAMKNTFG